MMFLRTRARKPATRPHALRPRLESLEDRVVLSAAFGSVLGVGNDTASIAPWDNAVDSAGNTYVTGILYGTMDFDPAVVRPDGSDILTSRGSSDAFVAKYAPDNSLVWARRMGSDYVHSSNPNDPYEEGKGIAVDGSGNVYVTGNFVGQADFGPFTLTGLGSTDVFVTKLDPNGNVLWAKGWGGATREHGTGIAVDGSGNVVSAGFTATLTSTGAWTANGFEVHKYSPTGAVVWSKRIDDYGGEADSVATDTAGNVYLCGQFSGTVDFNPDPHKTNYASGSPVVSGGGGVNGYVLELTAAGAFGWVSPFVAKTSEVAGSGVGCNDLALDAAGDVVIGGTYRGQDDFNPSPTIDYRLPNISTNDGYVAKLSSRGSLMWATPLGGASVQSLAVDTSGSVYAVGTFSQVFTPGFGFPAVTSNGREDVFVTKLTASGAVNWAVTFGGTGDDLGTAIAVDATGTVYVAGTYRNTVDFDPDPLGTYYLTNPTYADMFLLKLKQT
jgi:hypothetical protein